MRRWRWRSGFVVGCYEADPKSVFDEIKIQLRVFPMRELIFLFLLPEEIFFIMEMDDQEIKKKYFEMRSNGSKIELEFDQKYIPEFKQTNQTSVC